MAGVFRIALIGAAPAVVARHGDGRRERPILPGHARFDRRDLANLAHERGIVAAPKTDVVREDRGADHDWQLPCTESVPQISGMAT